MEPPPRSLALDAHYCIMVRVPMAHRIQVRERDRLRQLASSPRYRLRAYHDLRQATHRRTDGLRVPWVETRTWSSFKQTTRSNDLNQRLDRNHPIQVLGIASGSATVRFGGEGGETVGLTVGDVAVI